MTGLQQPLLLRLRDQLSPIVRRTVEDIVLETIERKGIPSRTAFEQLLVRVDDAEHVVESAVHTWNTRSGAMSPATPEQFTRKASS